MGKRLLEATREGSVDVVRQLVVGSGAPFSSDSLGATALHLAAQNSNHEIAEILLKGGLNRDARTKLEQTALHYAARSGSLEVVDVLLSHGSDVNARDMLRMTPLHWAVERQHIEVAERLLVGGADLYARSKFRLTPVDIAESSQNCEILTLVYTWRKKKPYTGSDVGCAININTIKVENITDVNNINNNTASFGMHRVNIVQEKSLTFDPDYKGPDESVSSQSLGEFDDPFMNILDLELNFEPDQFMSLYADEEDDEPQVECLLKLVDGLQKENKKLRQRVEQLSSRGPSEISNLSNH